MVLLSGINHKNLDKFCIQVCSTLTPNIKSLILMMIRTSKEFYSMIPHPIYEAPYTKASICQTPAHHQFWFFDTSIRWRGKELHLLEIKIQTNSGCPGSLIWFISSIQLNIYWAPIMSQALFIYQWTEKTLTSRSCHSTGRWRRRL